MGRLDRRYGVVYDGETQDQGCIGRQAVSGVRELSLDGVGGCCELYRSSTWGNADGVGIQLILTIAIFLTFAGTFGSYSKKKSHKSTPHSHGPQKHGLKQLVTLGKKGKHEEGHYEYVYQPTASTDGAAYPLIPPGQYQPEYRQTVWQG